MEIKKEIAPGKRMLLLLRVSSKQQAAKRQGHDGRDEYDIPTQRNILTPWAESMGYTIIDELVEGGVSGYKVSANDRDEITKMKEMAIRGEFDVLGIYFADRLGRIADETPLIVAFLNKLGIKVLSYNDGEISASTHIDKLLTYIRYWQAEGESLKTSVRVKDAMEQMVKQGKWRGGDVPYGYRTVSRGTLNFKGRPIFDVEIIPEEAEIVRTIFRLYGKENYGGKKIAKYLNDRNIRPPRRNSARYPQDGFWSCSTVMFILKNKIYMGIYELGKHSKIRAISPVMDFLQIITEQDYNDAQVAIRKRKPYTTQPQRVTRHGSLMLTGLIHCGHCGKKYTSQRCHQKRQRADGSVWHYDRTTYRCMSFMKPKEEFVSCNKRILPSERIEDLVIYDAKNFISDLDKEKVLTSFDDQIREQEFEIQELLRRATRDKLQKDKEVQKLKDEVMKVLLGESQFEQGMLSEMLKTKQSELDDLVAKEQEAQLHAESMAATLASRKAIAEELTDWSARFDAQDTMSKKSMLLNIIDKITVHDERVEVMYDLRLEDLDGKIKTLSSGVPNDVILSSWFVKGYEQANSMADAPRKLPSIAHKETAVSVVFLSIKDISLPPFMLNQTTTLSSGAILVSRTNFALITLGIMSVGAVVLFFNKRGTIQNGS